MDMEWKDIIEHFPRRTPGAVRTRLHRLQNCHCVVLLEDVDATSVNRIQDSNADANRNGPHRKSANPRVSLSTHLNVLDGLGSSEGRVLIMTTNHIERLDQALIRPGRVDTRVEFNLADEDMISQLFCFVYDPQPINEEELGKVVKDCELSQLTQEFMAKVPKLEFSPAEIMSLLLANKQSPRHAIASVDTWLERIGEERKKFGRANSWALDDSDGFSDH